jgi:hypothetical protein
MPSARGVSLLIVPNIAGGLCQPVLAACGMQRQSIQQLVGFKARPQRGTLLLMWRQITTWIKSFFGSGGPVQIGKDNQAVTGTTTGHNSPVINAARDVHWHGQPVPVAEKTHDVFPDVEALVPDLLAELRKDLAEHPLMRDMIVLDKKGIVYGWPGPHLRFSADEHEQIWQEVAVLEGHGLLRELRHRFAYRISEELATYLRRT